MCEINQDPSPFYILSSDKCQKLLPNWSDSSVAVFDLAEELPQHFDEIVALLESDNRSVKHLSINGKISVSIVEAKEIVRINRVGIGFSDAKLNPTVLEIPSGFAVIITAMVSKGLHVDFDTQTLTILK